MSDIESIVNPHVRHDFVLLFDVMDGNPNGDPDADNQPRVDDETQHGVVTDVCIKRKIRNYVEMIHPTDETYDIYVKGGVALNDQHAKAYDALGFERKRKKKSDQEVDDARAWMCKNFYDIRMFGAVMSTGDANCGQVRGPMQLTFGRSIDPIDIHEWTITRVTPTRASDDKNTEMGRKYVTPYALYKMHGFYSPIVASQTGVDSSDLSVFWDALLSMFDFDRAAGRGMMSTRAIYIFTHSNKWGVASAHELFDLIDVHKLEGVDRPRKFSDYEILTKEPSIEGISTSTLGA